MSSGIIVSKEMNIFEPTVVTMEYQITNNCFKVTLPNNAANDVQIGTSNPRYIIRLWILLSDLHF
jgi:hypothetical protein